MKVDLRKRPILAMCSPKAEIKLRADSGKLGFGGILMQRDEENRDQQHNLAGVLRHLIKYTTVMN